MSKLKEVQESYSAALNKINAIKAEFAEIVIEVLQNEAENFEGVTAFKWTQYTPYFNDGDSCEFMVNGYDVSIKLDDTDDFIESGDCDYKWDDGYKNKIFSSEEEELKYKKCEHFKELIEGIPEDVLLIAFGDHAEITVYPDRSEVEEYSHD